ncbi:MAG: hypothetical protein IKS83_05440, partial [Victivallales bacterium]|nr:hypothetical protein [Victivallales bacterium]
VGSNPTLSAMEQTRFDPSGRAGFARASEAPSARREVPEPTGFDRAATLLPEECPSGGLDILLLRETRDGVSCRYAYGCNNILAFRKLCAGAHCLFCRATGVGNRH